MRLGSKKGGKTKVEKELTRAEQGRKQKVQAFGIAAVIGILLVIALFALEDAILNKEDTVSVYQLTQDVSEGTKITEDNVDSLVHLKDIQVSLVPDGYITDKAEMIDKFTTHDYKAKEIITESGLEDKLNVYLDSIEDPVEISFSLSDLGSVVSGTLREGDYINMYGLQQTEVVQSTPDGQVAYYANTTSELRVNKSYTFEHLMITKVFNSSGTEISTEDEVGASTMFIITISEQDAQKFNEMIANCDVRLAKVNYLEDAPYVGYIEQQEGDESDNMPLTPAETTNNAVMGDVDEPTVVAGDTEPVGNTLSSMVGDGQTEGERVEGEETPVDEEATDGEETPVEGEEAPVEEEPVEGEEVTE